MKKKLFITASDKGGLGKSTFLRALLDHVRRHAESVRRIEGQGEAVVEPLRAIPVYVPDPAGVRSWEIGSREALAASRKRGSRCRRSVGGRRA